MKNLIQFSTLILLAVLLAGCSSTPRIYQQDSAAAAGDLIKVTCSRQVAIVELDGERLKSMVTYMLNDSVLNRPFGVDVAYVKPGRHELGLHWKNGNLYANFNMWFVAETEKNYSIQWKDNDDASFLHNGKVQLWIEEAGTGNHVGGKL